VSEYGIRRMGAGIFEVPFTGNDEFAVSTDRHPGDRNSPIPKYARLRVVQLINGFLLCDCCLQERVDISCIHTMSVIFSYFPEWNGPTHHEQSPRWWTVLLQFAHKPEHAELTAALEMVMANEHPAPRFPGPLPPAEYYLPRSPLKNVRDRVTNYS
jgi:hypothetical protein